ncbi:MAG: TCR/Tet family MFS transporter [Bacteroidetes bacterium]|nr:TCR/Tet family MFS transporter [Bacteroidota bacterium]
MKNQKNALLFIFITLLIDCTGIGIIIPVTPKLIQELIGGDISLASKYGGWLAFAYGIMQFLFSSVLGGLSDRYGRRPILLLSLLGLGVDYVFLALAPTIIWLFVGRMIAGISGASFTTASAYIADISEPEKRAQNFGMVGAAFGLGFILGPLIGGLFADFGSRVPFLVAAGLSLLNALYGFFVLPESLSQEHRRAFDWKRANPIGTFINLKRHKEIIWLIVVIFLLNIAGQSPQSTWTYYTILKFDWSTRMVGASLAFVGLSIAIVQGGLIRVIVPKLGQEKSVYLGFAFSLLGYILFAFATQGWMMFAFMIPFALGGIAMPAIQGVISNRVPDNEQGEMQGAITSLISITSIIGPVLMTELFYSFTQNNAALYFPGAPFMMSAILVAISLFIAAFTIKKILPR